MSHLKLSAGVIERHEPGFEAAALSTLFNRLHPGRLPEVIVQPRTVPEVAAAIERARKAGLKVSVCSGGHSWSANHLREGSLLIDMSLFNTFAVDRSAMKATAGPGVGGSTLLAELCKQGLFFPAGHCKGVCIGGYLLQGGFAWNGRKLGLACESVLGLDIVTADGRLVHASETENADLYWAARGAGGGFFGVVVQFHLRLYPRPRYCGMASLVFGLRHFEEVFNWAYEVGPQVPDAVEFQLLTSRRTLTVCGPGIEAVAPVFADTKAELEAATAFLRDSPVRKKAFFRMPYVPMGMNWMYRFAMTHYPSDHHWGVDNMWTRAHIDALMPFLKGLTEELPPAPAHWLWLNWQPPVRRSNMAFSVEDRIYIALYGSWKSPADTARYQFWARDWMKKMAHLASGIQLADEGLHQRPARFLTDPNLQKMDAVRSERDPAGVFHEWHSRG